MSYRGEIVAVWIFSFLFVAVAILNYYGGLSFVTEGFFTGYNIYDSDSSVDIRNTSIDASSFLFIGAGLVIFVTVIVVYLIYKNYEYTVDYFPA